MRAYPASRISKEARDTSAICMKSWIPTYEPKAMKSSLLLGPFGDSEFWEFSLLGDFMFLTSDNSQLCIDSQYSSQQLTGVWSLKHHISQPIYIFNRARVLHLDRLKEGLVYIALAPHTKISRNPMSGYKNDHDH